MSSERGPSTLLQAAAIGEALRSGHRVGDREFDRLYPPAIREVSHLHWTPVDVAIQAGRLLADAPGRNLLDIGSGVGKFCIVAAAAVGAHVHGVEQRRHLVDVAEDVAVRLGVDATFTRGTLTDCDPSAVDGIYLFNPFAENLSGSEWQLDSSVELSESRFWEDVATTEQFLRDARVGTRVVTYCGWGGAMPPAYRLAFRGRNGGILELWIKDARRRAR